MNDLAGFAPPKEDIAAVDAKDLQATIKRLLDTYWLDLDKRRIVLSVRFGDRLAWVAPDDYPPQPDYPVFTYKELLGLAKHGEPKMFDDMYTMKEVFCKARATGLRKKKTVGGFCVPEAEK